MATGNTPILLFPKSQAALVEYVKRCYEATGSNWNIRTRLTAIDRAYMREVDQTLEHQRAKLANSYGDSSKIQNVTVPVMLPVVESAVKYQASVFLTGSPIFGVTAAPEYMDEAIQLESVVEDNSIEGGWVEQFILFFRDGFKYNISAVEVTWERKVTASFETDLTFSTTQGKPKEIIWEGNSIKRLDMYNVIYDTRVPPTEVHTRGEFAGYTKSMSRIELKGFIATLPDKQLMNNVKSAFESGLGGSGYQRYFTPDLNPEAINPSHHGTGDFNWLAWAGVSGAEQKIAYKDSYEVTTLYARILPSDFDIRVPNASTPQIWKLIYINGQVLLYAERQTNAHNFLPIIFGQPLNDGLGHQTKSLASNVRPFQDITSSFYNSVIASRRRAISDRGIYDPSRISDVHINNPNPAAKIPVRPAAYGKPLSEAYFPIPFRDDQSGLLMQETQALLAMANTVAGQNPASQGQFVKGNKTLKEYDSVMSNSNGRDQLVSMGLEAQVFSPVKKILLSNILQFQGATSIYNRDKEVVVEIDPVVLRKAILSFKVSDGLTPSDKLINADAFQVSMQVIGSSPQIGVGYNLPPLFSYLMKTQGANLKPFEKSPEQMAYEQAAGQYQQMVMQLYKQNPDQDPVKLPPAPIPVQFNYLPTGTNVAAPATSQPPQPPQGA